MKNDAHRLGGLIGGVTRVYFSPEHSCENADGRSSEGTRPGNRQTSKLLQLICLRLFLFSSKETFPMTLPQNVVLNSSDIFSARRTSTGRPLSPKLPARPQSLHNEVGDRSSPKASQRQHAHHHRHLLHWDRAHFHLPYFQKRS